MQQHSDLPTGDFRHRPMAFVTLTFILSWAIWLGTWLMAGRPNSISAQPMMIAIYIGSFAPTLAAAVLSASEGGLRTWASGYLRWRIGWRALAATVLPLPLTMLGLTVALGYVPNLANAKGMPTVAFYATIFPASLLNGIATAIGGAGPIGEEGGWRGYLLPSLLSRFGEMPASLLLGVIWSAWHLPIMVLFPAWRDSNSLAFYLPVYTLGTTGMALFMTRVWLLSGRSLLPMIWIHGMINALGSVVFNAKVWQNPWSLQSNALHFVIAFWIAALLLHLANRRSVAQQSK